MWLQSNSKYDELADYDHDENSYVIVSKRAQGLTCSTQTVGWFDVLAGIFVALYSKESQLYLRVGEQFVVLTDEVDVSVEGSDSARLFIVEDKGVELTRISYSIDPALKISSDPTPFVEDEDFDFGLFVSNVSKSKERQRIFLGLK